MISWKKIEILCISPFCSNSLSVRKSNSRQSFWHHCCSKLANSALVSYFVQITNSPSISSPQEQRPIVVTPGPGGETSTPQKDGSLGVHYIGRALTESVAGLTKNSQELKLNSWQPNTYKQYEIHLKRRDTYCSKLGVSPQFASIANGLNFLSECYEQGYSYSALNTARSALSTVIMLPSTNTFGSHPLVVRLLKGVFNKRPSLPRYTPTWDINIVPTYLEEISPQSIK